LDGRLELWLGLKELIVGSGNPRDSPDLEIGAWEVGSTGSIFNICLILKNSFPDTGSSRRREDL
jgi:hypothetical protein